MKRLAVVLGLVPLAGCGATSQPGDAVPPVPTPCTVLASGGAPVTTDEMVRATRVVVSTLPAAPPSEYLLPVPTPTPGCAPGTSAVSPILTTTTGVPGVVPTTPPGGFSAPGGEGDPALARRMAALCTVPATFEHGGSCGPGPADTVPPVALPAGVGDGVGHDPTAPTGP